jgi:hypothetical protein
LHDVHGAGQLFASACGASPFGASTLSPVTTQKPSMQMRPSLQSDCFAHEKSPLRWLTEQLVATVIVATNRLTMPSSANFMVRLRR